MQNRTPSFRQRLAKVTAQVILGKKNKDLIPALNPFDGTSFGGTGRLNDYTTKLDQMQANIGWCFAANSAIADPCAAVEIKLYRRLPDGDKEEITEHAILDLLDSPNLAHTGEQLRQLHFTYMNFVGESYIRMISNGADFIPSKGKLPQALQIFPSHEAQFKLGETYTTSIVKLGNHEYPIQAFIRDLNPNPADIYSGRSIIAAAAMAIDTDGKMTEWNRQMFAEGARPSAVFTTNEEMSEESYRRWQEQFADEHTGAMNAHKPLLIEGGDIKPFMLTPQDLDFLTSREFSRDEILAMFKVNPGLLGQMENVNKASLQAAIYINAIINVVPRVRQFVRQLNATFVKVYDPTFFLEFVSPIPEDVAAKLSAAIGGVNKWWTADEVRDMYGEKPLPNGQGEHIIITGKSPVTLEDVVAGLVATPPAKVDDPEDPDNDDDDDLTQSGSNNKSLREKQVSASEFPGLYDDLDMVPEDPGCIMLDTQTMPILKHVPDGKDDLVDSTDRHDHTMGAVAESEAHVTLLYGLLENGNVWKDKVDTVLKDWNVKDVTISKVGSFDLGDSHAIVAHIKKTPELVDGHERLTLLPHIQTFSEYKPHLTLVYVQHDDATARKWVKALGKQYNGTTLKTKGINYGDQPDTAAKKLYSLSGVKKKN